MNGTALVLAAHGSRHEPETNESIRALARLIELRGVYSEVAVAFHQGTPHFAEVLDQLAAREVIVVPVMTSGGYYSEVVLPRELSRNRCYADMAIRQTAPVGMHPDVVALVCARLGEVFDTCELDPAAASVLIIGHGTPKHRRSRTATQRLADACQAALPARVTAAFIDDQPPIAQALSELPPAQALLVVPFFIGAGPHIRRDIPRLLGLDTQALHRPPYVQTVGGRLIVYDDAFGASPAVADIVLALAGAESTSPHIVTGDTPVTAHRDTGSLNTAPAASEQSAVLRINAPGTRFQSSETWDTGVPDADPRGKRSDAMISAGLAPFAPADRHTPHPARQRVLRLGSRSSRLARWQVNRVAHGLQACGVAVEIVLLESSGDRTLDCAIHELPGDAPFCDEIEEALTRGDIDLAVHSLKDMALHPPEALAIAAILPRGDASEALVTQHNAPLAELPAGARVGTSSPRRIAQLLALRPDLQPVPLRGPVDRRVQQVRSGRMEAAILASAGLQRLGQQDEIAQRLAIDEFLPAPGQAAIAVQARRDDREARRRCVVLHHAPTYRAVTAELEFLRALEACPGWAAAAYAEILRPGELQLTARLIALDGALSQDIAVAGEDPLEVATAAADHLAEWGGRAGCAGGGRGDGAA